MTEIDTVKGTMSGKEHENRRGGGKDGPAHNVGDDGGRDTGSMRAINYRTVGFPVSR